MQSQVQDKFATRHFCGGFLYKKMAASVNEEIKSLFSFRLPSKLVRVLWQQGECLKKKV